MEGCFRAFNYETLLVDLEDIIIFSKTFEEHVKHLDWVLVKNTKQTKGSKLEPKWEHTQYLVVGQPFPPTPDYDLV